MENKRIAKWDNLKLLLILFVVTGHALNNFTPYSDLAKSIYLFIYSFHMPVFVFTAGMFSKHSVQQKRWENVIEFLVIYVVMKFLESLANAIAGNGFSFHFLWEAGPGWFALAMAVFITVTMALQKYKWQYILAIALMIGCLAGLDTHFGDHFASMRICVFYPVFLAGYYMKPEAFALESAGKRILAKLGSLVVLALCFAACLLEYDQLEPLLKMFKGKYEYADMDLGMAGVLVRLACYVLWGVLICAVVMIAPERESFCTWLGKRTMAIFVWHTFVLVTIFKTFHVTRWLMNNVPNYYIIAVICIAFIVTVLCAYLPEIRVSRKMVVKAATAAAPLDEPATAAPQASHAPATAATQVSHAPATAAPQASHAPATAAPQEERPEVRKLTPEQKEAIARRIAEIQRQKK